MKEYVQVRVRVNNFTVFTVMNLIERVGTLCLIEMGSTKQIHLDCLTEIFRINRRAVSTISALVSLA